MQDVPSKIDEEASKVRVLQGTEDWKRLRCGRVTASRIADIMARTKSGWGSSRDDYAHELLIERLTGQPAENHFTNKAMEWGTATESDARMNYEFVNGVVVSEVAFVVHPRIEMSGASPDGLVGAEGLLEIKCPQTKKHTKTLLTEFIDKKYELQMQWQMACTGRQWCDFLSFDPRLPAEMQMCQIRVKRDPVRIAELEQAVKVFLAELDDLVLKLRSRFMPMAAE
jgi:putative phage-type endonuclease